MPDLFVSSARDDSTKVVRCVGWLRRHGVTVSERDSAAPASDASQCLCAVFLLSREGLRDQDLLHQIHDVAMSKRRTVLVLLDDIQLATLRTLPVMDVESIPAAGMSPAQIGMALVAHLDDSPVMADRMECGCSKWALNETRMQYRMRRVEQAGLVLVAILLIWIGLSKLFHHSTPAPEAVVKPVAVTVVEHKAEEPPAKAAPTIKPEPVAAPGMPRYAPLAVEHVKKCIALTKREDGLSNEQLNVIVSCFKDPTFIEGMGQQPRSLIRTSMVLRASDYPKFEETIETIQVESQPGPKQVRVRVKTHWLGENVADQKRLDEMKVMFYVVEFDDNEQPLVSRIEFEHAP